MIPSFSLKDGLIRMKNKLMNGLDNDLKIVVLHWVHSSSMDGLSLRE